MPEPVTSTDAVRAHEELSPILLAWLVDEPLTRGTVLDVGTGAGRLALALAPRARRVLGLDIDAGALVEARRRARRAGVGNVLFIVADAEQADYRALGRPDVVTAYLCMSDSIIGCAAAGLSRGGVLAFAALHVDQWRETGQPSRFAYDGARAGETLRAAGFRVEKMETEREVREFSSPDEARAATERLRAKWEANGRWPGWERFLAGGGRTLTESRLLAFARRT
jgi:SAM-dependent methyltransferase